MTNRSMMFFSQGAATAPAPRARRGVVRSDGRKWRDDDGLFYPLGGTMFWAVDGWRHERDRYQDNVSFFGRHRIDYQRVLADVGWATQQMDGTAPDAAQVLGELIDWSYDSAGVRTQVTCWGGSDRDPIAIALNVAKASVGREHKIFMLEAANESFQNGPDEATIDRMCGILRQTGCVVAPSCPGGPNDAGQWDAWMKARVAGGATVGSLHLDRSDRDKDWGFVRQPWDFRGLPFGAANNEPKGPRSSVAQTMSAPRLVLHRAVGILSGVSAFVIHNGAGVTGRVNPPYDRPANLWEVPGIDALMDAIRDLDGLLPSGLETWEKTTQHGGTERIGPHPLLADAIWSDGSDHGVSRCYASVRGGEFVSYVLGVVGHVRLDAIATCHAVAYDVETGATALDAVGRSFTLSGTPGADTGYLVRGTF